MFSSIWSIIILSKEPNSKHTDRYNLSLRISYSDSFTNLVSPKYNKKSKNWKNKITKCNNKSTSYDNKKVSTDTRTSNKENS